MVVLHQFLSDFFIFYDTFSGSDIADHQGFQSIGEGSTTTIYYVVLVPPLLPNILLWITNWKNVYFSSNTRIFGVSLC